MPPPHRSRLGCGPRPPEATHLALVDEWVDEFGPTAYLAVAAVHAPSVPEFAEHLEERLRERPCWLTRRRVNRSRRSRFVTASNLVLGVSPDLDELVGDDGRRLDKRVGIQRVVRMALDAGAKEFTVQSAIRLRCAGEDGSKLTTRLGDAAGLCFTEFPDCLRSIELQEDFARTFDAAWTVRATCSASASWSCSTASSGPSSAASRPPSSRS